jgi:hypothetical protein
MLPASHNLNNTREAVVLQLYSLSRQSAGPSVPQKFTFTQFKIFAERFRDNSLLLISEILVTAY